ncbi:hypothetical protein D9M69_427030 [compost metagenome]
MTEFKRARSPGDEHAKIEWLAAFVGGGLRTAGDLVCVWGGGIATLDIYSSANQ